MRQSRSLVHAPTAAYAALLGLLAACSTSNPSPEPVEESGGAGGVGGSGGSSGQAAGGTGGATGGTGGATGGAGGTAGGSAGATGGSVGAMGGSAGATGGSAGVTGGAAGAVASGGAGTGGASGGAPAGGTAGGGTGGTAGSMAGNAGDAGASGAGGSAGGGGVWKCPAGVTGTPTLGAATRVAGVPPPDTFNMENGNFGIIEGPVWVNDALYVSEMNYLPYNQTADPNVRMSRILKVTPAGQVTVEVADSGSNGLAIDGAGGLLAAVHKDGTIKRISLPGGATQTTVVGTYMSARFNSPNDLAIHSATGTLYFTDPQFQAPDMRPQAATRAYRVAPGGVVEPIPSAAMPDNFDNPNGITLSLAEDFLYVAAAVGRRYPVMSDGTLGTGMDFPATIQGDGMAIDCAGNLYVAKANTPNVAVFTPEGTMIGNITVADVQEVTNVAFGGADHRTLYVTGLGNNKGLFSLAMNLPGRPY
jgi:gluconolactonase